MGWATRFMVVGAILAVLVLLSTYWPVGLLSRLYSWLSSEFADFWHLFFLVFFSNKAEVWDAFMLGNITMFLLVLSLPFDLKPWVKARLPHKDTVLLSVEFLTLIVMPLIMVVASLYVSIFQKDALPQYDVTLRFSLVRGWIYAVICITAFVCLHPFKHLFWINKILNILCYISVLMVEPIVKGCCGVMVERFVWLVAMAVIRDEIFRYLFASYIFRFA